MKKKEKVDKPQNGKCSDIKILIEFMSKKMDKTNKKIGGIKENKEDQNEKKIRWFSLNQKSKEKVEKN